MFDFVGKKRWFFLGSAIIIIAGLISIFLPQGLKLGTDFKEGSSFIFRWSPPISKAQLVQALSQAGYAESDVTIQEAKGADYVDFTIITRYLTSEEETNLKNFLGQPDQLGSYEVISSGSVSPIVAAEAVRNAAIAVVAAALGILLYMAWAFRKMPKPFRYGTCAVIALFHDLLVVLAVFSLFGRVFSLEINSMFITACLAVLGYSVNDTVVVFDRIRENISKGISTEFVATVNRSLTETLTRSLSTTLTTLLACLAVYLIVGGPMTGFMLALLVGFASGAYSSFLASQLLVVWERGEWGSFLPKIPLPQRVRGGE
jgi:preprotein translocase subunit SecF